MIKIIHSVVCIWILSIPFWSKQYLIYGLFIPITTRFLQLLCGGCPLTVIDKNNNGKYFLQTFINATKEQIDIAENLTFLQQYQDID